jgi:hypothetical protein
MDTKFGIFCSALMLFAAGPTHAIGIVGANVNFGVYMPTSTSPISQQVDTVVGPGIELHNIANLALPGDRVADANVDFSATQISVTYLENIMSVGGSFNGYVMNFSGAEIPTITGVSLNSSTNIDSNSITLSFDSNSVFISLASVPLTPGSLLVVDVTLVPEPETYAMLLAGLGLMSFWTRRHNRRNDA